MSDLAEQAREYARKLLARKSLIDFGLRVMPNLVDAPHTRYIAARAQAALDTDDTRLTISAPPQHGKSTIVAQLAPAFQIGRAPESKIVLVSYSAALAERNARIVRELLRSSDWPFDDVKLSTESAAVDHFQIAGHSGYIHSVGVGGALTGYTATHIILDDLVGSMADATSLVEREKLVSWLKSVCLTRLSRGGKVLAIGTRWGASDILATLADMGFDVLNIPALSLGADEDVLDRPEGEALWPAHKDEAALAQIRKDQGELLFSTQYQGEPIPDTGVIFARQWLQYSYSALPASHGIIFSIDAATGVTAKSDPSVIAVLATNGNLFYVEHIERGNWDYPALKKKIVEMAAHWKPSRILIERASAGIQVYQDLMQSTLLPMIDVPATRSKVDRARAVSGLFEAGRVYIRTEANWYGQLLQEFLAFPNGKHDDVLDAVVMGVAFMREATAPGRGTMSFTPLSEFGRSPSAFDSFNSKGELLVPGVNLFAPPPNPLRGRF